MSCYEAIGSVKKAPIAAVTGSAQQLVAPIAGKRIRLLSLVAGISVDGSVKFSDSTPADLTGAIPLKAAAPATVLGYQPSGWADTDVGKGLTVTISAGSISGMLVYQEIN